MGDRLQNGAAFQGADGAFFFQHRQLNWNGRSLLR
jgi:hypothetical protein